MKIVVPIEFPDAFCKNIGHFFNSARSRVHS